MYTVLAAPLGRIINLLHDNTLCMCVYMCYLCAHVCMHAYVIYVCMRMRDMYACECVNTCMYVYMYVCVNTCMYVHMYVCIPSQSQAHHTGGCKNNVGSVSCFSTVVQ
jgi:hypothetical protein